MFIFLFVGLSIPPEFSYIENDFLLFGLILEPFASVLLGSLLGFLTKSRIRISTDGLVFNEESRGLAKFGSVYYEGSKTSNELVGHPPSMCTLILFITIAPTSLALAMVPFTPSLAGIFLAVSCGFLYPVGYHLTKRGSPIRTSMVKNPIIQQLTKYLDVETALETFMKCQYVTDVLIKYRHAESELLNLIDDVRVFIVTKTNPILEIEVTLENIQNIGLELTLVLDKRLIVQKEEHIPIDGADALLTMKDTGMNTVISITYLMNRFSARLALGSAKKNCKLLEALLLELTKHIPELTLFDRKIKSD